MSDSKNNQFKTWVRCYNCVENIQLSFHKGTRVHNGTLNIIPCTKCGVRGQMKKVEWNGSMYVRVEQ